MEKYPSYGASRDLETRRAWYRIESVPNEHGGFDIWLRIDGSYASADDAADFADHWRKELGIDK